MSSIENKHLMQAIFSEMSRGNRAPLVEAMAGNKKWIWMGTGAWAHTFEGKDSVVKDLLGAVDDTLNEEFEVTVHEMIAEGDYVVVEHSGRNSTPDVRRYDNNYCWVCRFSDGKLRELREYTDTQLVTETFGTHEAQ